jgi:hypothetical protein
MILKWPTKILAFVHSIYFTIQGCFWNQHEISWDKDSILHVNVLLVISP